MAVQNIWRRNEKKEETAQVERTTLEEKLTISGIIDAEEKATLRFQTGGKLTWVGVKEGDFVKKYQGIASLDQREMKKKLDKELNDYLKARGDYDQAAKDTYRDKVITDTIKRAVEKTQYDLNISVLDVEIQNLANELAYLFSPIEGIVTRVTSPYAGVNIIPAQAEFDIVNPKTVYFSASADQTEVVKLSTGKEGELTLDAYPRSTMSGTIQTIAFTPKTDETGTVYEVRFVFAPDTSFYRIGLSGDVSFTVNEKENALVVPLRYVKTEQGKKYLLVKRDGKKAKIPVETGLETDTQIEITNGVDPGETVYD